MMADSNSELKYGDPVYVIWNWQPDDLTKVSKANFCKFVKDNYPEVIFGFRGAGENRSVLSKTFVIPRNRETEVLIETFSHYCQVHKKSLYDEFYDVWQELHIGTNIKKRKKNEVI